jgi:predicted cupin superfamily sugar epimerase
VNPEDIIRALNLAPLPEEGGYFRETYRANEATDAHALPARYGRAKAHATAIYYLLTPDTVSALHRLPSDEVWHFYSGDPVEMLLLFPDGGGRFVAIGAFAAGFEPQRVVRRGVWQGSRLMAGGRWALLGTTVAPAFDFADYEAGNRDDLARAYPDFADAVHSLTRA